MSSLAGLSATVTSSLPRPVFSQVTVRTPAVRQVSLTVRVSAPYPDQIQMPSAKLPSVR